MNIDQTIAAYTKLSVSLIRMMLTVINSADVQNKAAELNTLQLSKGYKSDDTLLPAYSSTSVSTFGKPKGGMTLYDTGGFWGGFKLMMTGEGGKMISTDGKFEMLKEKYGDLIMGLNKVNEAYMENYINVRLMLELSKRI